MGLKAIAKGCPEFKTSQRLFHPNAHGEWVKVIAKGYLELDVLNVANCSKVMDEPIIAISGGCAVLKDINVPFAENFKDELIDPIAKACPVRRKHNIPFRQRHTDESTKGISNCCRELKVSRCRITDKASKASHSGYLLGARRFLQQCDVASPMILWIGCPGSERLANLTTHYAPPHQ